MKKFQFPKAAKGGFANAAVQNAYFCGLVHGYSHATGLNLHTMTSCDDWFILKGEGENGPRSAVISRSVVLTWQDMVIAVRAQLDALPFWTPGGARQ